MERGLLLGHVGFKAFAGNSVWVFGICMGADIVIVRRTIAGHAVTLQQRVVWRNNNKSTGR